MTRYLVHITLSTGHAARYRREDTNDGTISVVAAMLDGLLQGGRIEMPGFVGHFVTGTHAGRNLVVTLAAGAAPILTTAVCLRSRSSAGLWRLMHDGPYKLVTDRERPVDAPWVADRIEPGAIEHMSAMRWTGAWARCLGWAWMEYDR